MQRVVNAIVQSTVARTLVLFVVIVPIGFYLGTSPVRRGILYYLEVFAPSVVVAIACRALDLELEVVVGGAVNERGVDYGDPSIRIPFLVEKLGFAVTIEV